MKREGRHLRLVTLTLLFTLLSAGQATALSAEPASPEPPCRAELLLEASSGDILYAYNEHEPLPPASMVKLMVAYVTFKKVQEGSFKLSDVITASAAASKIGGSQVYLKQGEQFTLQELLEAVLVQSANDAAVAIAEHIGGSVEGFVEMMRAEAEDVGLRESELHSPHGLPPGKGQRADRMSAYDLAQLSRALIKEFPHILELTRLSELGFRNGQFNMRNHNHLVRTYAGCDGLKTGYYSEAGFGVTATAQRKGVRMIAVLMGCKERKKREAEAARLLSLGFAKYKTVRLITKGAAADVQAAIQGGNPSQVMLVTAEDGYGTFKAGEEKNVARKSFPCQNLKAPLAQNTVCGYMAFMLGDKEIGRVDLVVPRDIPQAGFMRRVWQRFFR